MIVSGNWECRESWLKLVKIYRAVLAILKINSSCGQNTSDVSCDKSI